MQTIVFMMDPSSAWQPRWVGVGWDALEIGDERRRVEGGGCSRARVCVWVRGREIEGWGVGWRRERGRERERKKAPESILPVTSLGLVPGCAALWSRLSRNHFSCCLDRPHDQRCGACSYGAARCFAGTPVFFFCSRLPVLSHISVNCFHTLLEEKRRGPEALN